MSERYSFSLTTFSPSGKLVQIQYAMNAVAGGSTSIGIKAVDGVVLATEKKLPSQLNDPQSLLKISKVHDDAGFVYSGMGPDSRKLQARARKIALHYYGMYREKMPAPQLVARLAGVMQEYTQSNGVRPFGCSLLIAGYDETGAPSLYQLDPSGSYWAWKASAIGKNMASANTFLEKRYYEDMQLADAIDTAILTLKEGFEGQLNEDNIEVGILTKDGFTTLSPAEVKDYVDQIA